jgi:hypothetical protein
MAMTDPLKELIDVASNSALVTMMETLRNAVEDRRRMVAGTFALEESVLNARLDDLMRLIDEGRPFALWQRSSELEAKWEISNTETTTAREASDEATRAASAAQTVHRHATREWSIEARSLKKQLTRLRAGRKRKATDLQSESDPNSDP